MDIVEELENAAWSLPSQPDGYTNSHPGPINVCTHAAAEIKRLRTAEAHALSVVRAQQETVERLRAELKNETRRVQALKAVMSAIESQKSHLAGKVEELLEAARTLDSEREANAILTAENERLRAELAEAQRAVEALLDFAGTVAPGASWWEDVWPEHEAAMAGGEK